MKAEEYIEKMEKEREEKEQLREYLKEAGILVKNEALFFDIYKQTTLRITMGYNGNHSGAIRGIVKGLETAMRRAEILGSIENYNLLEMRICAEVSVKCPEKLELLLDKMSEQSITNSNAIDIAREIGIENCLPEYLKARLKEED
ncbi:MAG: hypothetical protein N3D84_00300 [Candidatus Woesearchaeota archaeon]|nr:hypothetical protein [Candidatus Woesearchaeota archaeon]